ncbi:MAG: hypothetical protein IJ291_02365 [Lachnospiraceae bacterium]|nr:hypothetical protein [Lachnospiraceae bacterium]
MAKKKNSSAQKKEKNILNYIPLALGGIILIAVIAIVIRILIWNQGEEYIIDENEIPDLTTETLDYMFFKNPALLEGNEDDGELQVCILGNDTYRYNEDGKSIVEMLQENMDATIYDCVLEGSRLCTKNSRWDEEFPENNNALDAFAFFWLSNGIQNQDYSRQWNEIDRLPEHIDKERYKEVLTLMESIDFTKVDLMLVCYDGHDYLEDAPGSIVDKPFTIISMEGAMNSAYEQYKVNYPFMQLVFVAPTYCYEVLEDGTVKGADFPNEYSASLPDTLAYVANASMNYYVSYLDNYYGVKINGETSDEYLLEDGVIPNAAGRKLIADRIAKYINERMEMK